MTRARLSETAVALMALALGGCASTHLVNQWVNPAYGSARFQRIMVIAVSAQPSIRRTFEDEFVARLSAEGVTAVPSYRYIPEDVAVDEPRLREAARRAGADAAIVTRLVRVETETRVVPGRYDPWPGLGFGFYPGYRAAWFGYYDPPEVYQHEVYVSETTLYDLNTNEPVWSGTARTTETRNVRKAIAQYVSTVMDALKRNALVASSGAPAVAGR